jgi:branched-chain amino acid transport system substrate-binding protein
VKKTVFILSALLIVAVLAMAGCPSPAPPAEKTLQIGALMSLTGFFVVVDGPDWPQTQIAAELMNEQGGITVNGQQYNVELVVEDCQSDMGGTTAAANRLVFDKGIKLIIGPTAYFSSAAGPVTDPAEALRIITWCANTPGELDANTPYCFGTSHSSVPSAIAAMKYLRQAYPEVERVALVTPDDGAVPFMIPIVIDLLADHGITVVGDAIAYPNEMVDFSPIVAKVLSLEDIDGVFQANGLGPHVGPILKGLREAGNYQPYAASMPCNVSEFANIAGAEATENVFSVTLTAGDPELSAVADEIINRTVAQYGSDEPLHLKGANVLYIFKEAIEAADSLDPTVVKNKLESMGTVETIFGTGRICGEETFGIKHTVAHPLPIQLFKNGQVVPAGWIDIGIVP